MAIRQLISKKAVTVSGIIVLIYALIGFVMIPVLGKNMIREQLAKALGRDVSIEKMRLNPFSLTAGIEGVRITDKNKDVVVSVNQIFINLSSFSLFILTPVISEALVDTPYIKIIQNSDGSLNFSDLMKKDAPKGETTEEIKKGVFGFVIKNLKISNGSIDFDDKKAGTAHQVKDFSLLLPVLSSREKDIATPANMDIQLDVNGAKCTAHIESTPFADDLASKAAIKISGVNAVHYLAYLPLPETIRPAGLDIGLDINAAAIRKDSKLSLLIDGRVNADNARVLGLLDEKILSFPSLSVDIAPSDILSGELNISKVLLSSPEINIRRNESGDLNLKTYLPSQEPPSSGEEAPSEKNTENPRPFALSLDHLEIKEAVINFKDQSNRTPFETAISPLNLTVSRLKAGKAISGEFQMNFKTGFDETFESGGNFQTGPVKAKGTLSMGNFSFNRYAPYYETRTGVDIRDGILNLILDFEISQDKNDNKMMITGQDISIQSLRVMDRNAKEEIIHLPEFKISGSVFDLANQKIDTGAISARNGRILLKRNKEGAINFSEALIPEKKPEKKSQTPAEKSEKLPGSAADTPWSVTMNTFEASGFNLLFTDHTASEPVNIELSDITVKAEKFRNFGDEKGKFSTAVKWGKNGKIEISGDASPLNLNAGLNINFQKIDIKTLQPYFSDTIKILVTDGDINANGKLLIDMKQKSGKTIEFTGETSVTGFSSRDKKSKEDFFNCNSLFLTGLDISLFPVEVSAKEISVTDFFSKIMVSESGELNLTSIVKSDSPKDKPADTAPKTVRPSPEKPKINIGKITLQGGNIDFSDFLTKPNFKAGMKEIAGSLTGLSSEEQSRAKLHLQGVHSSSSPLEILGTINPLAEKKFADVGVSFKNIELSNFTPYSSKYLGYKIDKGKLILDLKYMIDGNALKSENRARFDNFELGEKVDSEHATSLPVSLAISLLKNRDGQIDLDIPVEGRLDDPDFKIGPIILKMIGNMILKVITSPFSIIGSLFGGGGDELGFAEFEFGDDAVKESDHGKMDKLADILKEKPSVKLEIQGVYNATRDAEGIRAKRFDDLLKEERSKKAWYSLPFSKAPEKSVPLTAEERDKYTEKAYDKAEFPKPRDEKGSKKKLDIEEKKKLLITHINIDENDLRTLAMTRAENIKAYILSTGKVEKERIFLLEPKAVEKEKTDQSGRVNFLLK